MLKIESTRRLANRWLNKNFADHEIIYMMENVEGGAAQVQFRIVML